LRTARLSFPIRQPSERARTQARRGGKPDNVFKAWVKSACAAYASGKDNCKNFSLLWQQTATKLRASKSSNPSPPCIFPPAWQSWSSDQQWL